MTEGNPYASIGGIEHFRKGTTIGDSPDRAHEFQLFILIKGYASLSMFSESGEETIIHYIGANEFFGYVPPSFVTMENGFISKLYMPGFRTCAKSDVTVSSISLETYRSLRNNVDFLQLLFKSYNSHYRDSARMRVIRSRKTALSSVASFILFFSKRCDSGLLRLDPFFTGTEISKSIGAHPVTVYKIISSLLRKDVLRREGHALTVFDEDTLTEYARGVALCRY